MGEGTVFFSVVVPWQIYASISSLFLPSTHFQGDSPKRKERRKAAEAAAEKEIFHPLLLFFLPFQKAIIFFSYPHLPPPAPYF